MAGVYMDSDSCHDAIRRGDSIKMKKFELFRGQRQVVEDAINMNGGRDFRYASKELRGDYQLCARAISDRAGFLQMERHSPVLNNGFNLQYASNELKADQGLFETAMMNCSSHSAYGFGLQKFPSSIREDKDLMLRFHNKHGNCFPFVGKKLQADKEFVHHVLNTEGWQIQYASDQIKDDKDMVLHALANSPTAYRHCSERLQGDKEVCLRAIEHEPHYTRHFPTALQDEIGKEDPVAYLTKAVNAEKLMDKLNMKLAPKAETRQQSMKMKI
ncbi:DUF4116 domain-containing protein [Variovorax sp. RA8]|uniref:DUF4116 domain-containing protein n=1 Tax=Variovorax sp. (strain JCM 16519 / RA8) TaxID=662548 RepID=UPI001318D16A|nr:DUF4116 domain-containing protein [Variovorax sp. RA8]VTU34727.1 hypothetical protein RA8CHR_05033 [Variovorax sp. RA8]